MNAFTTYIKYQFLRGKSHQAIKHHCQLSLEASSIHSRREFPEDSDPLHFSHGYLQRLTNCPPDIVASCVQTLETELTIKTNANALMKVLTIRGLQKKLELFTDRIDGITQELADLEDTPEAQLPEEEQRERYAQEWTLGNIKSKLDRFSESTRLQMEKAQHLIFWGGLALLLDTCFMVYSIYDIMVADTQSFHANAFIKSCLAAVNIQVFLLWTVHFLKDKSLQTILLLTMLVCLSVLRMGMIGTSWEGLAFGILTTLSVFGLAYMASNFFQRAEQIKEKAQQQEAEFQEELERLLQEKETKEKFLYIADRLTQEKARVKAHHIQMLRNTLTALEQECTQAEEQRRALLRQFQDEVLSDMKDSLDLHCFDLLFLWHVNAKNSVNKIEVPQTKPALQGDQSWDTEMPFS